MNRKKRADPPHGIDEKTDHSIDPVTSLTALIPLAHDPARSGEVPMPSGDGFARQFFRAWTRYLMLLCAILAICLTVSVPLLSRVRVRSVEVTGQGYYSEEVLSLATEIKIGDELLAISPGKIQRQLLEQYPYLSSVRVERTLSGRIHIAVTERTPAWAFYLSEERVALLDENMWVLEVLSPDKALGLCTVKMELFTQTAGAEQENPALEPGTTYNGNPSAVSKLAALSEAIDGLHLTEPPCLIDMSDLYAVRVCLGDGTEIALHECRLPNEQLRAGIGALQAYRAQHQNDAPMLVDVDDFSRVTLRPVKEIGK